MDSVKICSWNVNGLRSKSMSFIANKCINKECEFHKLVEKHDPDIICLGETKCQKKNEDDFNKVLSYKYTIWNSSTEKLGYSGVAVWSKLPFTDLGKIQGLEDNNQGRYLFLEFDKFYLINAYVPNTGGDKDEYRQNIWNPAITNLLQELKKKDKEIIYCGDLNVVHTENDIYNPDIIKKAKSPGVKKYERKNLDDMLELGYTDTLRYIKPNDKLWTWWDPRTKGREKDNGWRLDYFLISDKNMIKDSIIENTIYGSDHCPILLTV